MRAPGESCPPHCAQCAWDQKQKAAPKGPLVVLRTAAEYGCVKKNAEIVIDPVVRTPFMRIGEALHPLSERFGAILRGTRLEQDIAAVIA